LVNLSIEYIASEFRYM